MRLKTFPHFSLAGRAAAHRAMARAALFSDSSLRTRYQRYQHHMQKAHDLDAKAVPSVQPIAVQKERS